MTAQVTLSRQDSRLGDATLNVKGRLWRLAWDIRPRDRWTIGASVTGHATRAGAADPDLDTPRAGRYLMLDAFVRRTLTERLALRFEVGRSRYRSNIEEALMTG